MGSRKTGITAPVNVVFTGVMREHETFKKSINDLLQLRKENLVDKIVMSAPLGESVKQPEMATFLKQADVTILESEDPPINEHSPYYNNRDRVWGQMKSLEIGLSIIPKGTFVLKTRCDVYINPRFIRKLATEKESLLKITKNLPQGNVFKCKVWVPWFELTKPFFMADESFFGLKEDVEKLYHYNKDYFEKYDLGTDVHHVMRFIEPFLKKYPLFTASMSKYRKDRAMKNFLKRNFPKMYERLKHFSFIKKASERNRFAILNARLKEQDYLDLLAAYYYVLYSHFYIDLVSFPDQIVFRDFYKGALPRSDETNAEKNFTSEKVRFPGSGMLYFYEQGFVNALLEGKLEKTPLQEKLTEGLRRFEKH